MVAIQIGLKFCHFLRGKMSFFIEHTVVENKWEQTLWIYPFSSESCSLSIISFRVFNFAKYCQKALWASSSEEISHGLSLLTFTLLFNIISTVLFLGKRSDEYSCTLSKPNELNMKGHYYVIYPFMDKFPNLSQIYFVTCKGFQI